MARVLVASSPQRPGFMTAERLAAKGHEVVLHARDKTPAEAALRAVPATSVLVAEVSTIDAMRSFADQANALGHVVRAIHLRASADHSSRD